jgi:hypothetical protein
MVTALIVIGVILFLVFDAFVIARVLGAHRSAGDLGTISVPGETTVTVPAGKLKLTYQESYRAGGDEDSIDFATPAALEVTVTSPDGQAMELEGPGFRGMGSSLSTGSNWSRAAIGTVEISQPGAYTVSAGPELPDAVEPQVLIGK